MQYVTISFVHFSSKQLIFVYKHTLGTERLVTGDCSVSALIYKSINFFFLFSTKQIGQRKRDVHKVSIKSKNHLKRIVIREWEAISLEICRNFVNSMHRRCVSVIRAEGYATKYWNLKCLMLICFFFLYKLKSSVRTEMWCKIGMFRL